GVKPDEDIRLPMQWNAQANAGFTTGTPWRAPAAEYQDVNAAAQEADLNSLLNHYRSLVRLRRENPALSRGGIVLLETGNSGVYAFMRSSAEEKVLVLVNLKGTPISDYQLSLKGNLLAKAVIDPRSLFGTIETAPIKVVDGGFSGYKPVDELLPYGSYIFQLE
ncbi:MAG TPA: hypothetical protein VKP08_21830, partial [Anaerolineales bacterium]|nr:hypothetical protein [Anaerolineales bacterium]